MGGRKHVAPATAGKTNIAHRAQLFCGSQGRVTSAQNYRQGTLQAAYERFSGRAFQVL